MPSDEFAPEQIGRLVILIGKPFTDPTVTHSHVNAPEGNRREVAFRIVDSNGTTTTLCIGWEVSDDGQNDWKELERLVENAASSMRATYYGESFRLAPAGLEPYSAPEGH